MDKIFIASRLLPNLIANPACFDFSEEDARKNKLWTDERPMPTQAQLEEEQEKFEKEIGIKSLYVEMEQEVYDAMESTFGTRNDVSASAFAATWEAMISRPANYVDAALGLSDENAVISYATSKLNSADAYALWRIKRIEQFKAAKAALQA